MTDTYYKLLGDDRMPVHGGSGQWHRNAWMPVIDNPAPCRRGYHLVTANHILSWLDGGVRQVWVAKPGPIVIDNGDKVVTDTARLVKRLTWDDRVDRLFAADCAEHVLSIYEATCPNDLRPREAIEVARRFAHGEATRQELGAAWAAAWAAAGAAARAAAGAAAEDAARAAAGAARAAAWAAAEDAARAAARAAARDAEREWQTARLLHYLHGGER